MAVTDIGRVTPIWRGIYSAETAYELNDIVLDAECSVWWHVSEEITVGVSPGPGEIWAAVIDMSVFSDTIQAAIAEAQAAVREAEEAAGTLEGFAERAEAAANDATLSAGAASDFATAASDEKREAEAARAGAETAQTGAETAQSAAEAAQSAAETAQTAAETARSGAQTARTGAEAARDTAQTYEQSAAAAKDDAELARDKAEEYAAALEVQIDPTFTVPGTGAESVAVSKKTASAVVSSASGNPVVLPDAAGERVLRSVKVNVEPVQSGSGDPAPDNVRPITGWTGAKVTRCGKNLFDQSQMKDQAAWNIIPFYVPPGTQLCMSTNQPASGTSGLLTYFSLNGSQAQEYLLYDGKPVKFTVPNGGTVSIIQRNRDGITSFSDYWYQIEIGLTATEYEPYEGNVFEVAFPSEAGTVYGGVLDLTAGTLTVDRANIASYNGESLPGKWISSMDVYSAGATPTTGAQVVYELSGPVVYNLTSVQIAALAGLNTVWADCGPVEVEWVRDTEAVIEAANADTRAMIGEASGATASRSLAVGEYVTVGDRLYKVTSAVGAGETLTPGSNVTETTIGEELTDTNTEISNHEANAAAELKILAQIADRTYAGRNLTTVFASEIAQYSGDPWAWIKARITAGNYDGIHVGDYIPWRDTSASPTTRNARIMGMDTYYGYGDSGSIVEHHIDFFGGLWTNPRKPINKVIYNNGTSESEYPWLASDGYLYANSLAGKVPSTVAENPTLVDVDYTADGIYYYLPDILKAQIKTKRFYLEKRYTAGALLTESNATGWADLGKIWFPTEYEVYGAPVYGGYKYAGAGSAVQYPFWAGDMNRRMFGFYPWWILNPASDVSRGWCFVANTGTAGYVDANNVSTAMPICFRIA